MNEMRIVFAVELFDAIPMVLHVLPAQFAASTVVRCQGGERGQMVLFTNFILEQTGEHWEISARERVSDLFPDEGQCLILNCFVIETAQGGQQTNTFFLRIGFAIEL